MTNRSLTIAAILAGVVVITGAVWATRAYREPESSATIRAPGVKIDAIGDNVKIEAPYTKIEKTDGGTRIQAPGVDINLPPAPKDNE